MKHFLLILGLSIILISCSEDSNSQYSESQDFSNSQLINTKSLNDTLKNLFNNMVNSTEYKNLLKDHMDFRNKMNFNGDISVIQDENDLLAWISNNIHQTNFIDYNDAVTQYNTLKSDEEIIMNNNYQLYDEISKTDPSDLLELHDPNMPGYPYDPSVPNSSPCVNECINEAVDCGKLADANFYASSASAARALITGNVPMAVATMTYARYKQGEAQKNCAEAYKECLCNCSPEYCS